jgi:hypothetical protein
MLTTPNPYNRQHVRDAVSADCHGGLQPDLTERWRCAMRYRSGTADLHIIVQADGSFFAQVVGGAGAITGCCLKRGG